jgi:hypothetical protein
MALKKPELNEGFNNFNRKINFLHGSDRLVILTSYSLVNLSLKISTFVMKMNENHLGSSRMKRGTVRDPSYVMPEKTG